AVWIVRLTIGAAHPDQLYLYCLYAATGAILGHNFPFYMNFKGGKGMAATAGLIFAFHPYFIVLGVILFFGTFFTTHYVSLGSLLVYAGFVIQMIVCGERGLFTGADRATLIEMYVIAFFLAALAYWMHRQNIVRLLQGKERKTYLTKKNKVDVE
ncbi:MAG: glycerol-3-phosphate acyltransferase, partial [Acetatifactor sp.]|nr:glycerol-3-phosphate acyltransferase [Acetatifactor sp.]